MTIRAANLAGALVNTSTKTLRYITQIRHPVTKTTRRLFVTFRSYELFNVQATNSIKLAQSKDDATPNRTDEVHAVFEQLLVKIQRGAVAN